MIIWKLKCMNDACGNEREYLPGTTEGIWHAGCPKCKTLQKQEYMIWRCDGPDCQIEVNQAPGSWLHLTAALNKMNSEGGGSSRVLMIDGHYHEMMCFMKWIAAGSMIPSDEAIAEAEVYERVMRRRRLQGPWGEG